MDSLKRCTSCGEDKPSTVESFYRQAGCKDGLTPRCRECARKAAKRHYETLDGERLAASRKASKQWMRDNPEWVRAYRKAKRLENPEAARARDARSRQGRIEQRRAEFKRWYGANQDAKLRAARLWRKENPEAVKRNYEAWRANNPESYRVTRKRAHTAFFAKPRNRLDRKVRSGIHKYLQGEGVSRSWQKHVGYTLQDLERHIERQFSKDMGWHNMGEWHLDHILPLSSFSYEKPEDAEFKVAWALVNLRPIWAAENLSKGDRRTLLV